MKIGTIAFLLIIILLGTQIVAAQESPDREGSAPRGALEPAAAYTVDSAYAEESPRPQRSILLWFANALGWRYILALPLSGLLSFLLTLVLVVGGKGKATGAALAFVVAIPFLIGIFGMFDGVIASYLVIAASDSAPKPSELAEGASMAMVTPFIGMLLMVPSYLVATGGLVVRSLIGDQKAK